MRSTSARALLLLLCALPALPAAAQKFDPDHTRFSFELRTRWGQRVAGVFPRWEGEVMTVSDGRRIVHFKLATGAVTVGNSTRYTAMARSDSFFDSGRYPDIEFTSDPHSYELVQQGGRLRGELTIRGVRRAESFQILPPKCERPGYDCDVEVTGMISREDYGLDGWQLALGDRVRFTLVGRISPQ